MLPRVDFCPAGKDTSFLLQALISQNSAQENEAVVTGSPTWNFDWNFVSLFRINRKSSAGG